MKVYMEVTRDKYQLPVIMTYSIANMAYLTHTSVDAIYTALKSFRKGAKFPRFIEVEIDWSEEG